MGLGERNSAKTGMVKFLFKIYLKIQRIFYSEVVFFRVTKVNIAIEVDIQNRRHVQRVHQYLYIFVTYTRTRKQILNRKRN